MTALKISNIEFKYNKKKIIQDLSIDIDHGIIGILGPNGAGKSTLMKILATILTFENGEITLNGDSYKENPYNIRKKIGYLPQDFYVYPNIKGREFLEFIAKVKTGKSKKEIADLVDKVIELTDLKNFEKKFIRTYSGGIRQRLGIAQALLGQPELLIIDEPTSGLDSESRKEFIKLLPKLAQNKIILLSSHLIEDIESSCNRLVIVQEGQVTYDGNSRDLIKRAENKVWEIETNLEKFNDMSSNVKVLNVQYNDYDVKAKFLAKECNEAEAKNVIPTLEDAYLWHLNENSYE